MADRWNASATKRRWLSDSWARTIPIIRREHIKWQIGASVNRIKVSMIGDRHCSPVCLLVEYIWSALLHKLRSRYFFPFFFFRFLRFNSTLLTRSFDPKWRQIQTAFITIGQRTIDSWEYIILFLFYFFFNFFIISDFTVRK